MDFLYICLSYKTILSFFENRFFVIYISLLKMVIIIVKQTQTTIVHYQFVKSLKKAFEQLTSFFKRNIMALGQGVRLVMQFPIVYGRSAAMIQQVCFVTCPKHLNVVTFYLENSTLQTLKMV